MLPMFFRGCFFFQWCPPLNKSRRLRVHAEHWWAQGCICALAWGFVPLSNIVYSFGPQPRALRISSCRQQKHRRVLIKASVGLAFRASGTTSDICSRSPWHPSWQMGSHLGLFVLRFYACFAYFQIVFFPQSDACWLIDVTPQQFTFCVPLMRFCRRVASIRGLATLCIYLAFPISGKCAKSAESTRKKKFEFRSYAWDPRSCWAIMGSDPSPEGLRVSISWGSFVWWLRIVFFSAGDVASPPPNGSHIDQSRCKPTRLLPAYWACSAMLLKLSCHW